MRRILVVFCTAAILYLSVSYWYLPNSPYAQYSLQNLSSPVLKIIGSSNNIFRKCSDFFAELGEWFSTRAALNERLKKLEKAEDELQQLKIDLGATQKIIKELEKLAKYESPKGFHHISVKAYGAPIGFYDAQLITAAPSSVTIQKDNVVVTEKGLIGRVNEASARVLRIMLITDMASRVPVKILETDENAIATGNGTNTMTLEYLQGREMITNNYKRPPVIGDILVTSGVGGIFPPNIPVGVVSAVNDLEISVKPFVAFHTLQVVSIIYDNLAL